MFTNVGNIYTIQTGVRSAEKTDASLRMQHHQPVFKKDNEYKQKQKHRGSTTTILGGESQNSISIDAVHDFLASIVQTQTNKRQTQAQTDDFVPSLFDTIDNERLNKIRRKYEAAKVINAYEHATHTTQNSQIRSIDRSNKTSLGLQDIKNDELYTLIKDIETLKKQGLQAIQIKKQKTFMESLVTAIDEEKSRRKFIPPAF